MYNLRCDTCETGGQYFHPPLLPTWVGRHMRCFVGILLVILAGFPKAITWLVPSSEVSIQSDSIVLFFSLIVAIMLIVVVLNLHVCAMCGTRKYVQGRCAACLEVYYCSKGE
jgi:hypothetical protein